MISVIYCGGDEYKIHFDTMSLVLSKTQMEDVAQYVIENSFNGSFEVPLVQKLEEREYLYEEKINELRDNVSNHIGNIEELIDDEETEPQHLVRELEGIKNIIEESE